MRINTFIAQASGLSRRAADQAIADGRVTVNGALAHAGSKISIDDVVNLDGAVLTPPAEHTTIMLHKPPGYVVSRAGQGSKTIYELLPSTLHRLQPVGRLDKQSSGLLLLTDDGQLAQLLTHPSSHKQKVYEIQLDSPLQPLHRQLINDQGLQLEDGLSRLQLEPLDAAGAAWRVIMHEGRNRQIRRTFGALGYSVIRLHRVQFGSYRLDGLADGAHAVV